MKAESDAASRWLIPSLFALGFFASVCLLQSHDPGAIDGATRALQGYGSSGAQLRGNNHLLYPWHLFVFSRALSWVGVDASSPYEFFFQMTYLNALAAALALAVFAILAHKLTKDRAVTLIVTTLFGASSAFWINAANPNEPMPGFFFSIAAAWAAVAAIETNENVYSALCAFLLAYAMATYQSMISILPALAIAMFVVRYRRYGRRSAVKGALVFAGSLALSIALIYATAYRAGFGLSTPEAIVRRFFTLDGSANGVWGHLDPLKLVSIWPAFLSSIYYLDYPGLRALFGERRELLPIWGLAAVLAGILLVPLFQSLRQARSWSREEWTRLGLLALVPLFSVTCLLYWDVSYSKLWMQPLAGAALGYAFVLHQAKRRAGPRALLWAGVGTALLVGWNAHFLFFPMHRGQVDRDRFLRQVNETIREPAVIFTEWDDIGPIFQTFYPGPDREFVSILEMDRKQAPSELDAIYRRVKQKGGHVYFMGVLNKSREEWDAFLGNRWGLAFDGFEPYRKNARSRLHARQASRSFDLYEID